MRIRRILCSILLLTYLLGIKDGFIALWENESVEPICVFPYRADSLPQPDQNALKQGIKIHSKRELLHILEDFLS